MASEQEVLRGGSPLSVAITVRVYSARSEWLRGDDERSSPVFGFKEKRSALGPGRDGESKFLLEMRLCVGGLNTQAQRASRSILSALNQSHYYTYGAFVCIIMHGYR